MLRTDRSKRRANSFQRRTETALSAYSIETCGGTRRGVIDWHTLLFGNIYLLRGGHYGNTLWFTAGVTSLRPSTASLASCPAAGMPAELRKR